MAYDKCDILGTLPRKSAAEGGHPNCGECGFQSCVAFATEVEIGKIRLSRCPYVRYDLFNQPGQVQTDERTNQMSCTNSIVNSALLVIPNENLFISNKEALREFSSQLPNQTELPTVPTEGGLFNWFPHNVTGDELNKLSERIQERMIEQNKAVVKIFQEFNTIYNTFSYLDKIYVQEILSTLNAAVIANKLANESLNRLAEQQNEIQSNQQDIRQLIEQQKKIIKILKDYKEKLEKLTHLTDIDELFDNQLGFSLRIDSLDKTTEEMSESISEIYDKVNKLDIEVEKNKKSTSIVLDEAVQKELSALQNKNATLSKSLLLVKWLSIGSLAFSLILLLLFLAEVLI